LVFDIEIEPRIELNIFVGHEGSDKCRHHVPQFNIALAGNRPLMTIRVLCTNVNLCFVQFEKSKKTAFKLLKTFFKLFSIISTAQIPTNGTRKPSLLSQLSGFINSKSLIMDFMNFLKSNFLTSCEIFNYCCCMHPLFLRISLLLTSLFAIVANCNNWLDKQQWTIMIGLQEFTVTKKRVYKIESKQKSHYTYGLALKSNLLESRHAEVSAKALSRG
jgi:hypothetical protein